MEDIEFAPVRTQPLGPIYRIGGVRAPTKSLLRLKGETCPQVDGSNACARKEKRRLGEKPRVARRASRKRRAKRMAEAPAAGGAKAPYRISKKREPVKPVLVASSHPGAPAPESMEARPDAVLSGAAAVPHRGKGTEVR